MNILIIMLQIINALIVVYVVYLAFSFFFNLKNYNLREANADFFSIFMVIAMLILASSIR